MLAGWSSLNMSESDLPWPVSEIKAAHVIYGILAGMILMGSA
jgi:hypothetical protein